MKNLFIAILFLVLSISGNARAQHTTIDINSLPVPTTGSTYLTNTGTVNGDWIPVNRNGITYKVLSGQGGTCSIGQFASGINAQGQPTCSALSGDASAFTVTATNTTASLTLANQTALTVDAQQFGALQNGFTTDNTDGINQAINAMSTLVGQNGQMAWVRIHGNAGFCGIIMKRNVGLEFVGGELKALAGCAAEYPISSENFATNHSNNYQCGTNATVPSWIGFRNAKIDLNGAAGSYSDAGVALYGASIIMEGVNVFANGKNSPAVWTTNTTTPGNSFGLQCQEEAQIDTLITQNSLGTGWLSAAHDTTLGSFIGAFDADCSFVGGNIDHANLMHTYGGSGTGCGYQITDNLSADVLMTDGDMMNIGSTNFAPVRIGQFRAYNVGFNGFISEPYALNNQSNGLQITSGTCEYYPGVTGTSCIINGTLGQQYADNVTIGNITSYGSTSANVKTIVNYANGVNIPNVQISGLTGSGAIGIEEHGTNNRMSGILSNNTTMIGIGTNANAGGSDVISTSMFTASSQVDISGTFPASASVSVHCSGSGTSCRNIDTFSGSVGIGSSLPRAVLDLSQNTGALILPVGTTGLEPSPAYNGMIRYNSTTPRVEAYVNNVWSAFSTSTGTVTNIATTSPIGGGPITTTGTVTCSTCVVASSPGTGIAHFAGSTQIVTSSAIGLTADVSGILPVANGGTNSGSAGITSFNNITGYTASGSTGTTSTNLVFSGSPTIATPTFTTSLTSPLHIGGAAGNDSLTFESTSSSTHTTDFINFKTGAQVEAMRILSGGTIGIGTSVAAAHLNIYATDSADVLVTRSGNGGATWTVDQFANLKTSNGPAIAFDSNVSANSYTNTADTYLTSGNSSGSAFNIHIEPSSTGTIKLDKVTTGNMLCLDGSHNVGHCTGSVVCAASACTCTCTAN